MVVGSVASEITIGIAEIGKLGRVFGAARVIHDIGNAKAEEIAVKFYAFVHIDEIEPKMAQAANFKRLIEENAADVEFSICGFHRDLLIEDWITGMGECWI